MNLSEITSRQEHPIALGMRNMPPKKSAQQVLFFMIIMAIFSIGSTLHAAGGLLPANEEPVSEEKILAYLLPEKHRLQPLLATLFDDPNMFESYEHFKNAGFEIIRGNRFLLIGKHPSIPDYLFKKFSDKQSQQAQLNNYVQRIEGANVLRQAIRKRQFKRVVVPKKWLYELPSHFSKHRSEKTFLLIVERMDIYTDHDERKLQYYNMDIDVLTEFCTILHDVGGCDAYPLNQPLTRSGKIAFVDTEHVGKRPSNFKLKIIPNLNPELQAYALALWEKLEEEKAKKAEEEITLKTR